MLENCWKNIFSNLKHIEISTLIEDNYESKEFEIKFWNFLNYFKTFQSIKLYYRFILTHFQSVLNGFKLFQIVF